VKAKHQSIIGISISGEEKSSKILRENNEEEMTPRPLTAENRENQKKSKWPLGEIHRRRNEAHRKSAAISYGVISLKASKSRREATAIINGEKEKK